MTVERDGLNTGPARLAIAVPAFGRATAIATSLAGMAEEAHRDGLNIVFHVSDDTPDASVEDALRPLIDAGLPILYRRNAPSLGHDRNVIATLLWPEADYIWPLGSNFRVMPGCLARVYRFLDGQDMLFLNDHADDHRLVPALRNQTARVFLRDLAWHQTMTGATIYSRDVQSWARSCGDDLIIMPDFPQISVMMGYASDHEVTIGWFGERTLQAAANTTLSYWQTRAVDVFVDNWAATIAAFPVIVPADQRTGVIRAHSARTNLFTTTRLIQLRQSGQFHWSSLRKRHFRDAMHLPMWKLVAVLALPIAALRAGSMTLKWMKRGSDTAAMS